MDNIFTICIHDKAYSGLLINDLPIFIASERNMNNHNSDYQPMHIRNINENTLQNFKMILNADSWNNVLTENNDNNGYY